MNETTYISVNCIFDGKNYQLRNIHCSLQYFLPYEISCFFNTPYVENFNCIFNVNEYRIYDVNSIIPLIIRNIERLTINCYTKGKGDLSIYCYFLPNFKFFINNVDIRLPITYRYTQNCYFERGFISQYLCNFCIERIRNINCYFVPIEKHNIVSSNVLFNIKYNFDVKGFINIGDFIQYLCNYSITIKRDIYCYFTLPFINVINSGLIKISFNDVGYNIKSIFSSVPIFYQIMGIVNDNASYNIYCYLNYNRYEIRNINCYFVIKQTNIINLYDLIKAKLRIRDYQCITDGFVYNLEVNCFYEVRERFYKINYIGKNTIIEPDLTLSGYRLMEGDIEVIYNKFIENIIQDKERLKLKLKDTGLYSLQIFTKYGNIISNRRKRKRFIIKFIGEFDIS